MNSMSGALMKFNQGFIVSAFILILIGCDSDGSNGRDLSNTAENPHPATGSQLIQNADHGLEIENTSLVLKLPPSLTSMADERYAPTDSHLSYDFNNDGLRDYIYSGVAASNAYYENRSQGPTIYFGQPDGTYLLNDNFFIDNRSRPGYFAAAKYLAADFNQDGFLDFFVSTVGSDGDLNTGTGDGSAPDVYYLSQPDGTLLESSRTHMSDPEYDVFDHGAATGDIDNDGDMDIVITDLRNNPPLICWMNHGDGNLEKSECGGKFSFALELADMDNDGDLDALLGAHENSDGHFTGIAWNNGYGGFYTSTALPHHLDQPTVPEVSAADLDNDGDMDIVYSRAGEYYVGTSIQILENNGDRTFFDHGLIKLIAPPADTIVANEANEWNGFIEAIRFSDVDSDGDKDIFLLSISPETYGTILMNNGNFNFEIITADSPDYPLEVITEDLFIDVIAP